MVNVFAITLFNLPGFLHDPPRSVALGSFFLDLFGAVVLLVFFLVGPGLVDVRHDVLLGRAPILGSTLRPVKKGLALGHNLYKPPFG
jgi:hypothetical protein